MFSSYQTLSGNQRLQYAAAVNVQKAQCERNFVPTNNNFLQGEDANNVKNSRPLYEGQELIVAGVKKMEGYSIHAERLLLIPTEGIATPPMTNLLNRGNGERCTIFYSYKSPCVKSCLDERGDYNILPGLENWSRHNSIKAFVFKQIFWAEKNTETLTANFKKIVAYAPLFRCVSENECYACKGEGDTPIDPHCLPSN